MVKIFCQDIFILLLQMESPVRQSAGFLPQESQREVKFCGKKVTSEWDYLTV